VDNSRNAVERENRMEDIRNIDNFGLIAVAYTVYV